MKLTAEMLHALCKHYGITGKNVDALVAQYMSKYEDYEVRSCTCREIGGRPEEHTTIFYWTREYDGKKEETLQRLLDFRQARVNKARKRYEPPEATIYDTERAIKHIFCGKDVQKCIPLYLSIRRSGDKAR